jgi:hypothetical protein
MTWLGGGMQHTYERREVHMEHWFVNMRELNHSEDLDVERGNNIKMDRKKVNWDGVDWIDLVYGRGWRCVFVNAEIDFGFLKHHHHHHHHWLNSATWTLAFLGSFCQLLLLQIS